MIRNCRKQIRSNFPTATFGSTGPCDNVAFGMGIYYSLGAPPSALPGSITH